MCDQSPAFQRGGGCAPNNSSRRACRRSRYDDPSPEISEARQTQRLADRTRCTPGGASRASRPVAGAATPGPLPLDLIDGLTVEVRAGHGLVAGAREADQ